MSKVTIYTTPTCIFCHALMEWLDGEGVDYEQIDVSNPVEAAKAEKTLGHPIEGVPISIVNNQEIIGFDRPAFKKALKDTK